MSKFYVPKLYDTATAEEGEFFSIYDNDETFYGEFRLKYIDPHSRSHEAAMKRVRAKYAQEIRTKKLTGYDSLKVVLVELHMVDWRLPTDPNDPKAEPVPFTIDNALEYFSMDETKWIAHKLSDLCSEPTNFKGGAAVTPVEVGND